MSLSYEEITKQIEAAPPGQKRALAKKLLRGYKEPDKELVKQGIDAMLALDPDEN